MKNLVRRLTRKWHWVAVVMGVLAAAIGGSLFVSRSMATPAFRVIQKEDFGSWQYTATLEKDGWTTADITYGFTPAELKAFIAANRQMGHNLSTTREKPFHAIVTYKRPLSFAEFQQLVADAGISPDRIKEYTIRVASAKDKWWIITGPTRRGLIDEIDTDRGLADVKRHDLNVELLGVVYLVGSLMPDEYRRLVGDDRVALIDVTHNVVQDRLSHVREVDLKRMSIPTGSPYAMIELFGPEAFQ